MIDWIRKEMIEYKLSGIKIPLIIMGHYPPYFYKSAKKVNGCLKMEGMIDLIDLIYDFENPVMYFSADAHNYQHLQIKNLEIIIAGTGGASLDEFKNLPEESIMPVYEAGSGELTEDKIKINSLVCNYGWIDCEIDFTKNKIKHKFNELSS